MLRYSFLSLALATVSPSGFGFTPGSIAMASGAIAPSQHYIKASNTDAMDRFGRAASISGDTLVVGAPLESSGATGIGGDQADNTAPGAGAVYVYTRDASGWVQQAYIKGANAEAGDAFGWSVAIDGDTLVVGAVGESSGGSGTNADSTDNSVLHAGAAYVFVRNAGAWTQQAYLKGPSPDVFDQFGSKVAIEGNTLVVGNHMEDSLSAGVNGDFHDDSGQLAGAVHVFERNGSTWQYDAYLKASNPDAEDQFGTAISISGDTIVVGAVGESSAGFGINSNQTGNAFPSRGAAYLFTRNGSTWEQVAYVKAFEPWTTLATGYFGQAVAISGERLVIGSGAAFPLPDGSGSMGSGTVYTYERHNGVWFEEERLRPSNPSYPGSFGSGLSLDGERLIVGDVRESSGADGLHGDQQDESAELAGAAYLFSREAQGWVQRAYIKASNSEANDQIGTIVGISGGTVMMATEYEQSAAVGINGDGSDNSLTLAGAAYVYELGAIEPSGLAFCFGDGSGTPCPCTAGAEGAGCANSGFPGARLTGSGAADTQSDEFVLTVTNSAPATPGLLLQGSASVGAGLGNAVGNGLFCVSADRRWSVQLSDASGATSYGPALLGGAGAAIAGSTQLYQWWYRDAGDSCGGAFNFSSAWSVTWR